MRLPLNPPTTGPEGHGDEQPQWLQNFLPFLWLSYELGHGSNQDHKTKPPRENFHLKLQRRSVFASTGQGWSSDVWGRAKHDGEAGSLSPLAPA